MAAVLALIMKSRAPPRHLTLTYHAGGIGVRLVGLYLKCIVIR
jgi:hypothetical protein